MNLALSSMSSDLGFGPGFGESDSGGFVASFQPDINQTVTGWCCCLKESSRSQARLPYRCACLAL